MARLPQQSSLRTLLIFVALSWLALGMLVVLATQSYRALP